MRILGIIPARYASTRFPGKPLIDLGGKSMIQRVIEQAEQATSLRKVVVATDDERIAEHVRGLGKQVVMTDASHLNGTARCAEAYANLGESFDAVINIQGDEPFIHPSQIDLLATALNNKDTQIATLVKKLETSEDLFNSNIVKCVFGAGQRALYFSRSAIPHLRGVAEADWMSSSTAFYKHIGIYGYKSETLPLLSQLEPTPLELVESLEQLRWLENNFFIRIETTDLETIGIDTPEDVKKILHFFEKK